MSPERSARMNRLCIHTMTTKPWSIDDCARHYPAAGVRGITVWRQHLEGQDIAGAGAKLRDAGLEIVSLCRGGFFPRGRPPNCRPRSTTISWPSRRPTRSAPRSSCSSAARCRDRRLKNHASRSPTASPPCFPPRKAAGVRLAIEPLHPMYADDRTAINTMAQAHAVCDALGSPENLGIAVDVYHVWWDDSLEAQIKLAGERRRLFAFHVCDWKTPTTDLLNDRGLMGEGCIPIRRIKTWVEAAGFDGFNEVEIFSNRYWAMDQSE